MTPRQILRNRSVCAVFATAALLSLTACGSGAPDESDSHEVVDSGTESTPEASEPPADEVVPAYSTNSEWCDVIGTLPAANRIMAGEATEVSLLVDSAYAANCYVKTDSLWLIVAYEAPVDQGRWAQLLVDTEPVTNNGAEAHYATAGLTPILSQKTADGTGAIIVSLQLAKVGDEREIAARPDLQEIATWVVANPAPLA